MPASRPGFQPDAGGGGSLSLLSNSLENASTLAKARTVYSASDSMYADIHASGGYSAAIHAAHAAARSPPARRATSATSSTVMAPRPACAIFIAGTSVAPLVTRATIDRKNG